MVVVVRVNTQCSLRCQFCGFSRDLQRPLHEIDEQQLLKLGSYLQKFQLQTQRKVLVSWLGGEPFQWSAWRPMSEEFRRNLDLSLSVTTNGLALHNQEIRAAALNLFEQITISIDGLAAQHDHLRQRPGMFARLQQILKRLCLERDPSKTLLRVNTVLTRDNVATFSDFCATMAQWGFDELTFNPLGGNDRPEFFPKNRLTPEHVIQFEEQLSAIRETYQSKGLKICGSRSYLQRMLATAQGRSIEVSECWPGEDFLFVDEIGQISPCSFTAGQFDTNVSDPDSFPFDQLVERFRATRRTCRPAACLDCHANHLYAKFNQSLNEPLHRH